MIDIGADLQRAYDEGFKEGQETERPRAFGAGYKAGFDNASRRPKGEWKLVDHLWECDCCQYRQNKSKPTNFCPDCGADMRGDKDV